MPDPLGRYRFRYWDGSTWTENAYTSVLAIDPLPGQSTKYRNRSFRAGSGIVLLALFGLVAPFALGTLAEVGYIALKLPGQPYSLSVVFSVVLWTGLFITCRSVSRRYGTGSLRFDFQIRLRAIDVVIALLGAFVARVLSSLVGVLITHSHLVSSPVSNSPLAPAPTIPPAGWLVLFVTTCIGAPLFEELYFRGLLQGLFAERIGPVLSIWVTAAVFATAHIFNAPGLAGVAYAAEIFPAGLVLCTIKMWFDRLGATMLTHFLFNAAALALLAYQLGELHL